MFLIPALAAAIISCGVGEIGNSGGQLTFGGHDGGDASRDASGDARGSNGGDEAVDNSAGDDAPATGDTGQGDSFWAEGDTDLGGGPVTGLRYYPNPASLVVGVPANLLPLWGGSAPVDFTISPALPPGLTLDALTGAISGTPLAEVATALYTVTAWHPDGSSEAELSMIATADTTLICSGTSAHCSFLTEKYVLGEAAGNFNDWYRNCDLGHSYVNVSLHPQVHDDYGETCGQYYSILEVPERNVIGNASLGVSGMWSMIRYYLQDANRARAVYEQYRGNDHYVYPGVYDWNANDPTAPDRSIAMYPYVTQSLGKSGSDRDKVNKFFYALAALRPAVKARLELEGMLIPTIQMIYRRSAVATDAEYLTAVAHPSAFPELNNELPMVTLAHEIAFTTIPPMAFLEVQAETYTSGSTQLFSDSQSFLGLSEKRFTTPAAIARIEYSHNAQRTMYVSGAASHDLNDNSLTHYYQLIRGPADAVDITATNTSGSDVRIDIRHHDAQLVGTSERLSNLVVVMYVVHNGHYFSAPAFITSLSVPNQVRTIDAESAVASVEYLQVNVAPDIAHEREWSMDLPWSDDTGQVLGWFRRQNKFHTVYDRNGMFVLATASDGRPSAVLKPNYSISADVVLISLPDPTSSYSVEHLYAPVARGASTVLPLPNVASGRTVVTPPRWGEAIVANGEVIYTNDGLGRVDFVAVSDSVNEKLLRNIQLIIGTPDVVSPSAPTLLASAVSASQVELGWSGDTDDTGVWGYEIYRDNVYHTSVWGVRRYRDVGLSFDTSHLYTVAAIDLAGNLGARSNVQSAGPATLWGQDNFEDGNLELADSTLSSALTWSTTPAGAASSSGGRLRVGVNQIEPSYILANGITGLPVAMEFRVDEQYVGEGAGALFLYQDFSNHYRLEISRDRFALLRVMDGVVTSLLDLPEATMNHAQNAANITVRVHLDSGELIFMIEKSNWQRDTDPTADPFTHSHQVVDADMDAVNRFSSGRLGFYQLVTGTWGVPIIDHVRISH